jgi:hypothetical protein
LLNSNEVEQALAFMSPAERARFDFLRAQGEAIQAGELVAPLSFREFIDYVTAGKYIWYTWLVVLADVLQRVADGLLKRVLVFAPPRHGKSHTVARLFPAYYLYRHPDHWFGLASYGSKLANAHARTARDFYATGAGMLGLKGRIDRWETGRDGGMWSAGMGGSFAGHGAHVAGIDDPVKDAEEAASLARRNRDRDWYASTFYTRLEPDGALVIISTRWDPEDLPGWLLEQERASLNDPENLEHWHIVNFEALREDPAEIAREEKEMGEPLFPVTCTVEPDWRKPGEALAPERYSRDRLLRIKARIGDYFFGALYQQRPRYKTGKLFTLAMLGTADGYPKAGAQLVRWWDRAATEGGGDRT